jgi:hypothetical protein
LTATEHCSGSQNGDPDSPVIDRFNQQILFYYQNYEAKTVGLAGSFNKWTPNQAVFVRADLGVWRAEISMLPPGRYQYKFVVNNGDWVADPENMRCEPDGFGGLNSVVVID